jgi:hypothetical protein
MKRAVTSLLLAVVLGGSLATVGQASVKSGATCAPLGKTIIQASLKYTCIKSGKNLVWSKGVKVTSPVTPTPSPTPSPTQTPTQTPTVTAQSVSSPNSFSDLYEKRKGISTALWMKVNSLLTSSVQLPPVEIYRGPTTPIYVKDPEEYFKFVAQLFLQKALPKKIVVFYWNHQDMSIVAAKALSVMGAENDQLHKAETTGPFVDCYTPTSCDVGHGFVGVDGVSYLGFGVPDTLAEVLRSPGLGGVEVTEFYHSLNLLPFHLNSLSVVAQNQNIKSPNLPPFWMNQGSEGLMQSLLANKTDLNGFIKAVGRKSWTEQTIPDFSPEWINNYLNIANLGNAWSDSSFKNSKQHLIMGNYLMEIFTALKGPSVMLDFYEQMAQKKSFESIFQSIFGTTWNEAKPELVKVIYDRYLNNY